MATEKYISKEDCFQIITEYIYLKERTYFEVVPELRIKETAYGETPDMTLYLERSINGEKVRTILTDEDVKTILSTYVESPTEELESFLYNGGIHYMGYFNDQDTAYFSGVFLYIKQKEKKKPRYLHKKK